MGRCGSSGAERAAGGLEGIPTRGIFPELAGCPSSSGQADAASGRVVSGARVKLSLHAWESDALCSL